MTLVIFLDEDNRLDSGISGAHSEFFLLDTSRPFTMIGVAFKPGGGFPFVNLPAGELHNLGVPLDAVWGRDADAVRDRLLDAKTPAGQVRHRRTGAGGESRRAPGRAPRRPLRVEAVRRLRTCAVPSPTSRRRSA